MDKSKSTPYANHFNEQKELELAKAKDDLKLEKIEMLKSLLEANMIDENVTYPLEQRFKPILHDYQQEEVRDKIMKIIRTL